MSCLHFLWVSLYPELAVNRAVEYYRSKGFNFKRIIIVGAGKTGLMLFRELHSDLGYGYKFLGFFDDNAELKGQIPQLLGDTGMVENLHWKIM